MRGTSWTAAWLARRSHGARAASSTPRTAARRARPSSRPAAGGWSASRACLGCGATVDAGRAPALRTVERDGRRFAYWRDPAHIAYFGHEGVKVSDLVVAEERKRQYGDQGMGVFDWLDDWLSPA